MLFSLSTAMAHATSVSLRGPLYMATQTGWLLSGEYLIVVQSWYVPEKRMPRADRDKKLSRDDGDFVFKLSRKTLPDDPTDSPHHPGGRFIAHNSLFFRIPCHFAVGAYVMLLLGDMFCCRFSGCALFFFFSYGQVGLFLVFCGDFLPPWKRRSQGWIWS